MTLFLAIALELLGAATGAALWYFAGWSPWTILAGFLITPIAVGAFLFCLILRSDDPLQ